MSLRYVFTVRFRLETASGVSTDPQEFETTVRVTPPPPGDSGWMLFRDALWRGEVNDPVYARQLAQSWLDVPVVSCSFAELRTDEDALSDLREAIAADLDEFNADSVREVLHKYFGSAIHVEKTDTHDR
ncbi:MULTISPECIES: LWR-salt protein [Haloferax]|uniref:LWR-salt protein n=2 Tax=Haloferax TaxID=2251 RepID=A0A6G1Z1A8_9EURY|nr:MULTISPECIES: LWR-salt protein [Haloferax]KAB1187643.1 LWR-salt protein [Haloferax sp. CBA1149]MRW80302.1 LWR-salt protein [Haloferax marinisediminis]